MIYRLSVECGLVNVTTMVPFRWWLVFLLLASLGCCNSDYDATIPSLRVVSQAGSNVTLDCPDFEPSEFVLALTWEKKDTEFLDSMPGEIEHIVELKAETTTMFVDTKRVSLKPRTYALLFHPVLARDSGLYSCLINNEQNPTKNVLLLVQDIPDPPQKPIVSAFKSRTVDLSWGASRSSNNSPIKEYLIYVREGENSPWNLDYPIRTGSNRTSHTVTSLRPYTVYSFKVAAVNALGRSRPSKESFYVITLMEVPEGQPTIIAAHNSSSSSIKLSWRPPDRTTIHGEFEGYKLTYRPRDPKEKEKSITLRNSKITTYILKNLRTFTQYLVTLQVFNGKGSGPSTTVVVMTDEGVPSKPKNLTVLDVNNTSAKVSWQKPDQPNGLIQGYRIYFRHNNYTDVESVRLTQIKMAHILQNLAPFTSYEVWVKAFTWKNEGESSNPVLVQTDVQGPGAATITNLSCQSQGSLKVQWSRPETLYGGVDFYYVYYRAEDERDFKESVVSTNIDKNTTIILLTNLTMGAKYELKIQAAAISIFKSEKLYRGEMSKMHHITISPTCELIQTGQLSEEKMFRLDWTLAAGVICGVLTLLFIAMAVVMWWWI